MKILYAYLLGIHPDIDILDESIVTLILGVEFGKGNVLLELRRRRGECDSSIMGIHDRF